MAKRSKKSATAAAGEGPVAAAVPEPTRKIRKIYTLRVVDSAGVRLDADHLAVVISESGEQTLVIGGDGESVRCADVARIEVVLEHCTQATAERLADTNTHPS